MVTYTRGEVHLYVLWKYDNGIMSSDTAAGILCIDARKLTKETALHPSTVENIAC
jgi:hypothetical protein